MSELTRKGPRLFAATFILMSSSALAGGLYLNDVKVGTVDVSGVDASGLEFDKAKVRIDERGNLFVEVKGYAIAVESADKGTAKPNAPDVDADDARLTRRYFLVTEQVVPGMTDYDVDLYINSKWVRKLRDDEQQIVTEVTNHLHPGRNTVLMVAKKLVGGEHQSRSVDHVFRVIIGEGNVSGDNVMIDNPVVTFKRTAADLTDVSQEFTFTTR